MADTKAKLVLKQALSKQEMNIIKVHNHQRAMEKFYSYTGRVIVGEDCTKGYFTNKDKLIHHDERRINSKHARQI